MYISFLEEYLREENTGTEGTSLFIYEFFALFQNSQGDFRTLEVEILETGISRLENFLINSESTKFSDLMEEIFGECEAKTDRDQQFRWLTSLILSKMKKYVKGFSYNKDSEVLKIVMIFFTSVSAIDYSVLGSRLFNLIWQ